MLASLIETLTQWCAPWNAFYSDSRLAETAVMSLHLVAILLGGGLAIAADRTTLRAARLEPMAREGMLEELHAVHRPVLLALAVLLLSGVATAAADIATFSESPFFLVKLLLVMLLCANGAFLYRTEALLRREASGRRWRQLSVASWLSLSLWVGTVIAGAALVNSA